MSNTLSDNLINLLLAALIVVTVIVGIYFFFKDYILDFIKNLIGGGEETPSFILSLIK